MYFPYPMSMPPPFSIKQSSLVVNNTFKKSQSAFGMKGDPSIEY